MALGTVLFQQLSMTRDQLASLEPAQRRFLLLGGHAVNELLTLQRLMALSVSDDDAHYITEHVGTGRSFILLRVLLGKVWECHELIRQRVLSNADVRQLLPLIPNEGREALERCKRRLGKDSRLAVVRGEHAFHYPSDDVIDKAFQTLPGDEPLCFYLSNNDSATFYYASELLFAQAVMSTVAGESMSEKIGVLLDDAFFVSKDLIIVLTNIMSVIVEKLWNTDDLEDVTVNAPLLSQTSIPPISSI